MKKTDKIFSFMLDYTNRNLRRYAAERFVDEGLEITVDQWGALLLLRDSGDGLSNSELASQMSKDKPTVTRIVDVLVRKSLVVRQPNKNDRRQQRISLTRKGKSTVSKAEPIVKKIRKRRGGIAQQCGKRNIAALFESAERAYRVAPPVGNTRLSARAVVHCAESALLLSFAHV